MHLLHLVPVAQLSIIGICTHQLQIAWMAVVVLRWTSSWELSPECSRVDYKLPCAVVGAIVHVPAVTIN
jgi:hypothetical protein